MSEIKLERNPSKEKLEGLGVFSWGTWEKEESEFPWHYDSEEQFYVLEGDVVVTPEGGEPVHIQAGDLVTCPAGMSCTWKVNKPIRKHFTFR
jgi:uncharacterized cupin superfamily protein